MQQSAVAVVGVDDPVDCTAVAAFYNRTRQHLTLGYQSPIQYLDRWKSEQNQEMLTA
jgi:hypothetical protein